MSMFLAVNTIHSQCSIHEASVIYSDCDELGQFYASLNFEHRDNSASFKVIGNGRNYGTFHYNDLPVKIGPLDANCTTVYEFVVIDAMNDNCRGVVIGGTQCCESNCNFLITDLEAGNCENNQYGINFSLTGNYGNHGVDVFHNGKLINTIDNPEKRIHIGKLNASLIEYYDILVVCAQNDPTCCDTFLIPNPCICNIYNIKTQIVDCDENEGTFSVKINFDHLLSSDSFNIGGNSTNYGKYSYKDLPVTISGLPFDSLKIYEFIIADDIKNLCFNYVDIGPVTDCHFPCQIDAIKVVTTSCDKDGNIYAYIKFDDKNTSVDGFTIRGNGHQYGSFQYGNNSYKVGPLDADCQTIYEFVIIDNNIDSCFASTHLDKPLCCDTTCSISHIVIKEVCDGEKLQHLTINFTHQNTLLGKFKLQINRQLIGIYSYDNLPVQINKEKITGKILEIRITDFENESCVAEIRYEISCEIAPCSIKDFIVEPLPCNDEGIFDFFVKFNSKSDNKYILKVNGQIFDTLLYSEHGQTIGSLKGDCKTKYNFLIYQADNVHCAADYHFDKPICCDDAPCSLSTPRIKIGECIDNQYSLQLSFEHSGSKSTFLLYANGHKIGIYAYADLPVILDHINADNSLYIEIFDSENEKCKLELTIPSIDCTTLTRDSYAEKIRLIHDNLTLQIVSDKIDNLKIIGLYDIRGRFITCQEVELGMLDIQNLNAGIYLLRLEIADKIILKRFIKI